MGIGDAALQAALLSLVLNSAGIGVFLPSLINSFVSRWVDNNQRKIAVWVICLFVSIGAAAYVGAFAPVAVIYASQGALPAVWAAVKVIGASWGTLTVVASQMYDKVLKPTSDAAKGKPDLGSGSTIAELLATRMRSASFPAQGIAPTGPGIPGIVGNAHSEFDLEEGNPTLDAPGEGDRH